MAKKGYSESELLDLRTGGIIKQKQKDYFILRTRIPGGYLKTDLVKKYYDIAKKYGKGYVHISTRQGIEIPWIHLKNIGKLLKDIKKNAILKGACGPRSRNVVACPGSSVCRFGFVDTQDLARKLDKVAFGKSVPKKFKVSITGCLNSCAKPQENDLGFQAEGEPEVDLDKCISCTLCAEVCEKICARGKTEPAITMDKNNKPIYKKKNCYFEGDCVRVCPVDAWKVKRVGFSVYIGGKVGRFPRFGDKIASFVDEKQIPKIIQKTVKCYNGIAKKGQRFGEAVDAAGVNKVKDEIL